MTLTLCWKPWCSFQTCFYHKKMSTGTKSCSIIAYFVLDWDNCASLRSLHCGSQAAQVGVKLRTVPVEVLRTPSRRLSFTPQSLHLSKTHSFVHSKQKKTRTLG